MKKYKIFYEFYPFNVEDMSPKIAYIDANSLSEAFEKLEKDKGKGNIEIFKEPAIKHYIK